MEQITLTCRPTRAGVSLRLPRNTPPAIRAALNSAAYCGPALNGLRNLALHTEEQYNAYIERLLRTPGDWRLQRVLLMCCVSVDLTPAGTLRIPARLAKLVELEETAVLTLEDDGTLILTALDE